MYMFLYEFGVDSLYNKDNYSSPMYKIILAITIFLICLPCVITFKYRGVRQAVAL